jgi:hypothetical protein
VPYEAAFCCQNENFSKQVASGKVTVYSLISFNRWQASHSFGDGRARHFRNRETKEID